MSGDDGAPEWGKATLRVVAHSLSEEEFFAAVSRLGEATGESAIKRTRRGPLWRSRSRLPTDSEASDLWRWAVREVESVLGPTNGPPEGCTADLFFGFAVRGQRGLWCSAEELGVFARHGVDVVLDLYS